jgi:hypothetical protein
MLRHRSFSIASLAIGLDATTLRYADLVVARSEGAADLDWELMATTLDRSPVDHGAHHLVMATAEGGLLEGDAILVRSIDGTHVFRGAGPLDGFDPGELDG